MAKGITYFCDDKHGNGYTRYSAGHTVPMYSHAVISRRLGTTHQVSKGDVQYSSRLALAQSNFTKMNGLTYGDRAYEAELVVVRAHEGRHSVEPK